MTPIGIDNGNFRNGDYREWATQDLSGVPTWEQLMEEKRIKETYGVNWESDADAVRQLLESVEQAHPVETAYELEKAMDEDYPMVFNGGEVGEFIPYRPATSDSDFPF